MEQTILTLEQQRVLQLIGKEEKFSDCYLSGGTALSAYYLHHRYSDDLDFFCSTPFDTLFLELFAQKIQTALETTTVRFEKLHDRRLFFFSLAKTELKIEFTVYPFASLETTQNRNGVRVDSLRDLAANKLAALLDRFDPKDFVDLYFLLQDRSLNEIREDTKSKFQLHISDLFLGGALAKVRRIEALPKMIRPLTVDELKHFFTQLGKKFEPTIFE